METSKIVKKNRTKKELEELMSALAWNDGYGCFTRAGFEKMIWPEVAAQARWIIFFDIDDMHSLNAKYGYEGVNARIKESLSMRSSDFMAGQWFSGDEFIVCITDDPKRGESDPMAFCERMADDFRKNGTSATFAIVPVRSMNLFEVVTPANEMVRAAKRENRRGSIAMAALDGGGE